jgi:hypothetical protein
MIVKNNKRFKFLIKIFRSLATAKNLEEMMNKILMMIAALLLVQSVNAQSTEVMLNSKKINYGALAQETNKKANELIVVKRTATTPKKVVLTYSVNYMEKKCVRYEVKVTELPNFTQTVCESALDGTHECLEKEYTGLYSAKTICSKNGLVRATGTNNLTLDFRKAVKLTENATETFQVNLKQGSISKDNTTAQGKALDTASQYKVKTSRRNTLKFRAK